MHATYEEIAHRHLMYCRFAEYLEAKVISLEQQKHDSAKWLRLKYEIIISHVKKLSKMLQEIREEE